MAKLQTTLGVDGSTDWVRLDGKFDLSIEDADSADGTLTLERSFKPPSSALTATDIRSVKEYTAAVEETGDCVGGWYRFTLADHSIGTWHLYLNDGRRE